MKTVKQSPVSVPASTSGVLVGRFDHALDPKRRLTIPAEWRSVMGAPDYVYVFPDPSEPCLDLIPPAEMEVRLAKLREAALFDPEMNAALQAIGENAEQLVLDVQGRIRICDKLLSFAGLDETVAMVGSIRVVKLWSPKRLAPDSKVDVAKFREAVAKLKF